MNIKNATKPSFHSKAIVCMLRNAKDSNDVIRVFMSKGACQFFPF